MRVLSIDLDYCMDSCIAMIDHHDDSHQFNPANNCDDPIVRWRLFHEYTCYPDESIFIDKDKVEYCFDLFQKALKHCDDVIFAYDHDAILYRLDKDDATDIDLINIDHHDDILNGTPLSNYVPELFDDQDESSRFEAAMLEDDCMIMEGNWVGWLHLQNKIKSYTWIHGKNSAHDWITDDPDALFLSLLDNSKHCFREDYKFDDYKFDFIFVCLSPTYIPIKFWNTFTKFLDEYQKVKGKQFKLVNRKYEMDARYRQLNNLTLPPRLSD